MDRPSLGDEEATAGTDTGEDTPETNGGVDENDDNGSGEADPDPTPDGPISEPPHEDPDTENTTVEDDVPDDVEEVDADVGADVDYGGGASLNVVNPSSSAYTVCFLYVTQDPSYTVWSDEILGSWTVEPGYYLTITGLGTGWTAIYAEGCRAGAHWFGEATLRSGVNTWRLGRPMFYDTDDSEDAEDSGWTDTGWTDTGWTDTGWTDTGWTDTGWTDTGWTDTGWTDTGWTDTGWTDTGWTDTGWTDTGWTDTGTSYDSGYDSGGW